MKLRCLAIDDEPYALKQINDYILKTSFLELSHSCYNVFEAMEYLSKSEVDLIFIDINMPEMSGIDFVKTLPPGHNIIFTTAYSEYAVESYKVEALDYLLKPITYEDFLRSANKANKLISQKQPASSKQSDSTDHFFVKSEGKHVKINIDSIEYIESLNEYVRIHLTDEKPVITLMSLKNLEKTLHDLCYTESV